MPRRRRRGNHAVAYRARPRLHQPMGLDAPMGHRHDAQPRQRSSRQRCGLYRGAPAVAFTLHAANQPGYAKVLATLDRHIFVITRRRLEKAHERISRGQLPALREFDLIRGLTGIGVYLLYRHGDSELTRDVLSYLVRLTQPVPVKSDVLPGWWCGNGPGDQPSPQWPGGHGNLGLAHGISGPLALLSAAARRGVTVTGHADAIRRICGWLDQWRNGTATQAWWPGMISLPEYRACTIQQPGPGRPSWCYGTPGLARAQQLAALALADPRRQRHAEQALAGCITDEAQAGPAQRRLAVPRLGRAPPNDMADRIRCRPWRRAKGSRAAPTARPGTATS